MPQPTLLNADGACLWLPPLPLAACLRGGFVRDTRALPALASRLNHFPASLQFNLVWVFEGEIWSEPGPGFAFVRREALPRLMLAGPSTRPIRSSLPGPVWVLQLLFQADALALMTGLRPAEWVNRVEDARAHLPPDWRAWAEQLLESPDSRAALAAVEAFVEPQWRRHAAQRPRVHRYSDWIEGLALRAANTPGGRSLRQFERRIKGWAGLPMRELRLLMRGEQAFFHAAEQDPPLAELAADAGYADQSHLSRETRRITGFSPAEFARRVREDESFWCYRLWL